MQGMPMPDDDPDAFCKGMPMAMFMDGFHFSLGHQSKCLVYLVNPWFLSDAGKFKGAMVFSFLLALCLEGLSAIRRGIYRSMGKSRVLLTIIYALQGLLGYVIMFLAMSFSIELILSVVFGLAFGNLLFFRYEDFTPPRRQQNMEQMLLQSEEENNLRRPLLDDQN